MEVTKIKIGEVGVDAGMVWVGDPCYIIPGSHLAETWSEFCTKIDHTKPYQQWNYEAGHPGLGVTVSSGYGDGLYPVYAIIENGVVKSIQVVFVEEEDDDDGST